MIRGGAGKLKGRRNRRRDKRVWAHFTAFRGILLSTDFMTNIFKSVFG